VSAIQVKNVPAGLHEQLRERARAEGRNISEYVLDVPSTGLIRGVWSLRANLSAYDACYLAVARLLECPLLSTDAPLRRAPGLGVKLLTVG